MNPLNSVLIEGCLVGDPVGEAFEHDVTVARFTVANVRWVAQEMEKKSDVSYFDIECLNRTAALVLNNLKKGIGVRVVGRLKQYLWKGIDGQTQQKVKIVAETVEFKIQFNRFPSELEEV